MFSHNRGFLYVMEQISLFSRKNDAIQSQSELGLILKPGYPLVVSGIYLLHPNHLSLVINPGTR